MTVKIHNISALLSENSYPGRGIILGQSADARFGVVAYFIMGRSENSRNRVFEENERGGIRTKAFDESKMTDPSLIIYNPVLVYGERTIVTNGDQTDTIYAAFQQGKTFEEALRTRKFEPDAPNYTPRISGLLEKDGAYRLSVLKSADGDASVCERFFFEYDAPRAGVGHFVHTYIGDGAPLPSFAGEPVCVQIAGDIEDFTANIWTALNKDNKVSLFTRFVDLKTGEAQSRIVNKNQ